MRRVHWMELFFDLVFVVFIGELARGLRGEPGWPQLGGFLFVFAIGWWAWANVLATVNVLPGLSVRRLAVTMLLGMIAIGAMAAAAPEALGERAWVFAVGSAGLRLILLPLWFVRARREHEPLWRPVVYNGITAAFWIGSAFIPQPTQFFAWGVAVGIEVALLTVQRRGEAPLADALDAPHLAERLGLFVIIAMGESVFSIIQALDERWTVAAAATALLGIALIGMLAWTYFLHSANHLEEGLTAALTARNTGAIRDAVMFMPYVLVAGAIVLSAGIATAIEEPDHPLSLGSSAIVFGGIASFYLTISLVGIRLGRPARRMMAWLLLGAVVPGAGLAATVLFAPPALPTVALAVAAAATLTIFVDAHEQRHRAHAAAPPRREVANGGYRRRIPTVRDPSDQLGPGNE